MQKYIFFMRIQITTKDNFLKATQSFNRKEVINKNKIF